MDDKLKQLEDLVRSLSDKKDAELREALNDKKPEMRFAACWVAGDQAAQGLCDDLIAALSDHDGFVRQSARRALVILANRQMIVRASKQERVLRPAQFTDFGPPLLAGVPAQLAAARRWTTWFAERDAATKPSSPIQTKDPEALELSKALAQAAESDLAPELEKLREGKGDVYTEALADAIARLKENPKRLAREALVDRFTRLPVAMLRDRLGDRQPEIRRAAALAAIGTESRALVPDLIKLLEDPETTVSSCAHIALKAAADVDYGPALGASAADRKKAAVAWKVWLNKQILR